MTDESEIILQQIIKTAQAIGAQAINPNDSLQKIGLDSLDTLELVYQLEKDFGIKEMPIDSLTATTTIREMQDRILKMKTRMPHKGGASNSTTNQ